MRSWVHNTQEVRPGIEAYDISDAMTILTTQDQSLLRRPDKMAWFGDRLSQFSNLTDQISSFTKEVLTETTEEVEGS